MRELPAISERRCGVFTASEAAGEGWSRSALRWAVRRGVLVQHRPTVYQRADLQDLDPFARRRWLHAAPAIAAVLTTPGAQASHSTAAVLRGVPLAFVPALPCVTVVPWHTGEIVRTHVHRATSEPAALPVAGVVCMSAARTAIDLAREHGVAAGVVAFDYALRHGLADEAQVWQALDHCRGWPGVRAAREAAAAADPRSESVLESLSRLKLVEYGFAADPQVTIADASGEVLGRVDFFWPDCGVVGEVDGELKYAGDGLRPFVAEKRRQELLERTNLIVVRWGWSDLRTFDEVVARLRSAMARGLARPPGDRLWQVLRPVAPPTLTPRWP